MKVLIVSHNYWPESFRINEVVLSLIEEGCEVTVLTGQPNYPEGKTFPGYRAWSAGTQRHPAGYEIHRVPISPRRTGSALALGANYLSFIFNACLLGPWLLRGQHFDVVFVYAPTPVLHGFVGLLLGFIKHAPVTLWIQDLWPESLEATGFVRNRRVLSIVGHAVSWLYRRSDLVLVQSPAFLDTVRRMAGSTPVEYHPNPGELAFNTPHSDAARALTLEDGFNVIFAGNFGTVQALDTILDAAHQVLDHPDVRFVLVGSGSRSDWLRAEVERRGLSNVVLPGRFPPEAMPGILAQASALLVTLVRSRIMSQTLPSKVQAYLAAGRPIIASMDGIGGEVVVAAGAGMASPAEDAEALARAVLALRATAPEELSRMGRAARACYDRDYDPATLAERLRRRFTEVATDKQRRRKAATQRLGS